MPIMIPNRYRNIGIKESTELDAQITEHSGKYIKEDTNEKVHSRVADVLSKHNIATSVQSRILEIGCGPFESLHDVVGEIKIGIDPLASFYLANLPCKRLQSNIAEALAEILPFGDNFFDIVVTRNSFDHLNDPEMALLEFHRVLKKDGLCVIECYVDSNPFITHEPFVLTEKFINNYIARYFEILESKRVKKNNNFSFDWIELLLRPKAITLHRRPFRATIYNDIAESYLKLFARGCYMIEKENWSEAIKYFQQSLAKKEEYFWNVIYFIYAYLKSGQVEEAHKLIKTAENNINNNFYPYIEKPADALRRIIHKGHKKNLLNKVLQFFKRKKTVEVKGA